MNIERKSYPISEIKADDQTGVIEAIVSVFNNKDSGNEIVRPGFFTKSIQRKLPKGVWAHDWKMPIAKTLEAKELLPGDPLLPDNLKLLGGTYIKAQFNQGTQRGREAYSDVKFGTIDEFSIGYKVTKEGRDEKTGARELLEGDWKEWSPVLVGMNDQTALLSVKSAECESKSLLDDVIEEREESLCFIFDAASTAIYRAQMMDEMSEDGGGSFDLEAAIRDIGASLTERLVQAIASPEEEAEEDSTESGVVNPAEQADENNQTSMLAFSGPISFKGDLRAGSTFAVTTKTALAAVEVFANRSAALSEFITEYKERSKAIMETRFKDGRMYSSNNMTQMQRIHDAMGKAKRNFAQIHVDMGDLIAKAKKPEKSDSESLRTQSLRLISRSLEVLN